MGFILQDLRKYKRAKARAEALKWTQYLEPFQNIIHELEKIDRLDGDVLKGETALLGYGEQR